MPSIVCSMSAFAVASLFYAWRAHHDTNVMQRRQLRERIAYMLWILATRRHEA